ncbi:MAG TPA: Tim44/TimA family putative adaptor protein [Paenirhodobacter sp.]
MSSAVIQLIVLAAIAIFLILRLKNVLGTRDGFEKPVSVERPDPARAPEDDIIEHGPDRDIVDHVAEGSPAAAALAAMKREEPGFGVGDFLQGARSAYEMILMGFENGNLDQIRAFLSPDVLAAFEQAIAARQARGLAVHSEFHGLRELVLQDATFDVATKEAELTIRFGAELLSTAKDASGTVVEGDPRAPRKQRDVWTFARKMGSADPNWQLVATGA